MENDDKPTGIPAFLGIGLLVVGIFLIVWGPSQSWGRSDMFLYGSTAVAALGGLLWLFSGMTRHQMKDWLKNGVFALAVALTIRWAIAEPYRIPSGSMEPTLHGDPRIGRGDRVFVNKWVYGLRFPFMNKRIWYGAEPQRWDIVVFKTVEKDAEHSTLVKRIVGMPGERISIRNGRVFANDVPLEIPAALPSDQLYSEDGSFGVMRSEDLAVVPEGHYLVLGDNSRQSRDGRYFGWLPNEHIVGRVASIWWPPPRWRDFTGFSETWWWKTVVVLVLGSLALRLFIGRLWSMPAIEGTGTEHLLINTIRQGLRVPMTSWWLARWGKPDRSDLVLYRLHAPNAPDGALTLGRVAALPGEKVSVENGRLLVNGTPGADLSGRNGAGLKKSGMEVPGDQYYVISPIPQAVEFYDSLVIGPVAGRDIVGKATSVWWPLRSLRRL